MADRSGGAAPSARPLMKASRRTQTRDALVATRMLRADVMLPLVVRPVLTGLDLAAWIASNRVQVEAELHRCGALLFRGFDIVSLDRFQAVSVALFGELLEYKYRASPRTQLAERIYTSTDYPADQAIFPHNEHAYSSAFPLRLAFCCVQPSLTGGETPIGSTRRITARIRPDVLARFAERGVMYVRNYGDGFGLSWPTVFQATNRTDVEAYCATERIAVEWKPDNRLRTRQVGPALARHPLTGEELWFNHATFFHVSTLPPLAREELIAQFGADDLPTNTFYGDGSPIEPSVLDQLRAAYLGEMVTFSWQRGDVLVLDNMLAVHARQPFTGPRHVAVAMADRRSIRDCVVRKD